MGGFLREVGGEGPPLGLLVLASYSYSFLVEVHPPWVTEFVCKLFHTFLVRTRSSGRRVKLTPPPRFELVHGL